MLGKELAGTLGKLLPGTLLPSSTRKAEPKSLGTDWTRRRAPQRLLVGEAQAGGWARRCRTCAAM